MSRRLTAKRIQQWQADIDKADRLVAEVTNQMKAYKQVAKGGRLTALTDLLIDVRLLRAGFIGVASRLQRFHDQESK